MSGRPRRWPAPEARRPSGTAAADIGWREFFPDPQLQQLIAVALENNRDLRVAALNVQTAQARYRIQRAELFPTINASATEQVERFPPGVSGVQAREAPSRPEPVGACCASSTSASASPATSSTCSAASAV